MGLLSMFVMTMACLISSFGWIHGCTPLLCLNVQKRQYNHSGFPYCSPVAKDNNFRAAQTTESIIIEETEEVYAWILKSMKDIEPRWDMSKNRIHFGDQHVSTVLLQKLNIQESCTLQGD
jgi:hypothetical protein